MPDAHVDFWLDSAAAQRRLHRMERNLRNLMPAAAAVYAGMEREEARLFASLNGRYVRTGATRDSLTQRSADQAIREAHHDEFVFGTAVSYARFLRNPPILQVTDTTARMVGATILDHVMS